MNIIETAEAILSETFLNLTDDINAKKLYADQVWDLLEIAYADIGGIKGSGFNSKNDMVNNIPFWKLYVKNKIVLAVILYKDKGGRKSVALAIKQDNFKAKEIAKGMIKADLERSFGEKSKSALGFLLKTVPWSVLELFAKKPSEVKSILKKDLTAIKDIDEKDWPADAKVSIGKFPELQNYGYIRKIGKNQTFKVMFGSTGKTIK